MRKFLYWLLVVIPLLSGCSTSGVDYIKERANARFNEIGFEVIGYHGYKMCLKVPFTNKGGACVWYELKRIPDNGVRYSAYLYRWNDELHIYGPDPRDGGNLNITQK